VEMLTSLHVRCLYKSKWWWENVGVGRVNEKLAIR